MRVLVFGTFDLLHPGHLSFLRQAQRRGDELIVTIARDHTVRWVKDRDPIHDEKTRVANVRRLGLADRVMLARHNPARRFDYIRRMKPNVICLGYDQEVFTRHLRLELKRRGIRCRVVRLRAYRPDQFKSSLLRRSLKLDQASLRRRY